MAFSRGLAETARLVASLDLQDNFSRGVGTALGSVGRLESGLSRIGRGTGQVASGLDRLGTRAAIAAAGGLGAIIKTSASFEQAFTGIEKTVDASDEQFRRLEEQLRAMARSIPVSFEELAGIGEAGGALGIARQDLLEFTDVVARLAVSTNLSSDQAATALGQLGNVLHLRGQDFRDFADSLVALGNAGASTESQIVDIAARFGAAGNAAGLTKEEILALSSAVASMGIQTEAGGSALSRIFNSVATNIGTSSDKAVAFAKTLGLSAKEFRRAWQEDALGTFQDFLTELAKLDQFKQASVLKSIGITNTRDVNTVRLMGQNVKFVGDQLKIAKDANGALNTESQKFFDTATGQFKTLVNNLRDAGVTIGNEVLPIFKELVADATEFLNRPETRQALKEFGQQLADGIRKVVTELRNADFSGLIDQLKGAAGFAKTAFDAFNALPGPLKSAIIGGIAINKVTGGALGQITGGLGNIAGGLFGRGGIFSRGSSPANPLWVQAVGGGLGGPGGPGGLLGAGGGLLGFVSKASIFLGLAVAAAEGLKLFVDTVDPGAIDRKEGFRGPFAPKQGAPTPLGQFNTANLGGVPVHVTNAGDIIPPSAFDRMTDELRITRKAQRDALKEGDIHQARILEQNIVAIHALQGTVNKSTNTIVPHLGEVNRGLSKANRNLDDGNARQREMDRHIEQARRALGTGFRETDDGIRETARTTHRHLSDIDAHERATAGNTREIAGKDFSPEVNVTVPVTTTVSINDIIREQTSARFAVGRGFTPGLP